MRNNGIGRPSQGTKSRVIWEVIDSMVCTPGSAPSYPEVIQVLKPHGFPEGSVDNTMLLWRKFHGMAVGYGPVRVKKLPLPDNADVYLGGL